MIASVDHVVSLWNGLTSPWAQYINMVQIMRKLIEAERLGNWYLHLQAVSEKATIIGRLLCQVCQNLLKCHTTRHFFGIIRGTPCKKRSPILDPRDAPLHSLSPLICRPTQLIFDKLNSGLEHKFKFSNSSFKLMLLLNFID